MRNLLPHAGYKNIRVPPFWKCTDVTFRLATDNMEGALN